MPLIRFNLVLDAFCLAPFIWFSKVESHLEACSPSLSFCGTPANEDRLGCLKLLACIIIRNASINQLLRPSYPVVIQDVHVKCIFYWITDLALREEMLGNHVSLSFCGNVDYFLSWGQMFSLRNFPSNKVDFKWNGGNLVVYLKDSILW